jgi:hypothetical protein
MVYEFHQPKPGLEGANRPAPRRKGGAKINSAAGPFTPAKPKDKRKRGNTISPSQRDGIQDRPKKSKDNKGNGFRNPQAGLGPSRIDHYFRVQGERTEALNAAGAGALDIGIDQPNLEPDLNDLNDRPADYHNPNLDLNHQPNTENQNDLTNQQDQPTYAETTQNETFDPTDLIAENLAINQLLVSVITEKDPTIQVANLIDWQEKSNNHFINTINTLNNFHRAKTTKIENKINTIQTHPMNNNTETGQTLINQHNHSIKQIRLKQATQDRTREMETCERTSRLHNIQIRGGSNREHMLTDVKNHFNHDIAVINSLHNAVVTPLAREPNADGIRPISILFKSTEAKKEFENFLRTEYRGPVRASAHWPKDIAPKIKELRENLKKYKNQADNIDLTHAHILIRPTKNCKEISIKYRDENNTSGPWVNFLKFPTPLKDETYAAIGVNPPKLHPAIDPANYYDNTLDNNTVTEVMEVTENDQSETDEEHL